MRGRAWRRAQRKRVINNRIRFLRDTDPDRLQWVEPGALEDRHPNDCGKTQCLVCHADKALYPRDHDYRHALKQGIDPYDWQLAG